MMTYDQWTKETKRFTFASDEFSAINTAFAKLDKQPLPANEIDLARKLKAWLDSKGDGWKQSTRNSTKVGGKGTIERLIEELAKNPLCRQILGAFAAQQSVEAGASKIIVFSGHGSWDIHKDGYVQMPKNCSIKFYTMNMRTLSDALGGDIDRGIVSGLEPDQEGGPMKSVPDMRLYPPTGLRIRRPDPATWQVVTLPDPVPSNNKNLQIQIKDGFGGGGSLSVMLDLLRPALLRAPSVTFLWAACRAIGLNKTGKSVGVNSMQR